MITDTLGDLKEANQTGIKTIAVTWGVHQREKLKAGSPTVIIEEPTDLVNTCNMLLK